jgi:hypothetical protein
MKGSPAETSQPESTEQLLQRELGTRAYEKAEELRVGALLHVGIDPETLPDGVRHTVRLRKGQEFSDSVTVTIGADAQLHVDETSLRLITTKRTLKGEIVSEFGRFTEPNGQMWTMADSSQGEPWYESPLSVNDLAKIIDNLGDMDFSAYDIEIEFKGFNRAPNT